MYNAFLQRTKETINALGKHIRTSDRFRAAVFDNSLTCTAGTPCFDPMLASTEAAPDRLEWRVIDHCAAVTRIYAIYEQFTHEMIREHLSLLQSRLAFSDLPLPIQSSYRLGIARILDKKDGPRYADLDLLELIGGYDKALHGLGYKLEPRAMLMQDQNLRLSELNRFMCACGVDGMAAWIEKHRLVVDFFASDDRLSGSAESQMAELVKYRNDAAHGSIDIGDILHPNGLIEFFEFVSCVCEAIAERVQLSGLQSLKLSNHAQERGKIAESLRGGTVAIGEMTGQFEVGSTIYLCGENYCLERSITSIQLEGVPHERINLTVATEIGLMLDAPGRKNAVIMTVVPQLLLDPVGDFDGALPIP